MFDLKDIISQVKSNCDISDARYGGHYSVCGLFLRLRDLYKWEKKLDPWVESQSGEILNWIDEREQYWDTLSGDDLHPLSIGNRQYDPFDSKGIQKILLPHRFFYGGGYARGLKPTFFIGELKTSIEIDDIPIWKVGNEYARDLFTSPSLVQDDGIVYRHKAAMMHFWDQIFYVNKSGRLALEYALNGYGCSITDMAKIQQSLETMVSEESDRYIYHEIGEIREDVFDRKLWREIISVYSHSPIELLARGLKDLLADTCQVGPLKRIIGQKRKTSIGFYVAFLDGILKHLFPEIISAFEKFSENPDWRQLEDAVETGHRKAAFYARILMRIHLDGKDRNDKAWTMNAIKKDLLVPLGI